MKIYTSSGEYNLLTHCPLVGASEVLSFKSALSEATTGAEHRTAFRDSARQQFNFDWIAVGNEISASFNNLYQNVCTEWLVPVMQEVQDLGLVLSGDFIPCDTSKSDFEVNGLAIVYHSTGFKVVEIESIGRDLFEFDEALQLDVFVEYQDGLKLKSNIDELYDCRLAVLKICIISSDVGRKVNYMHSQSKVSFLVLNNPKMIDVAPTRYKSNDLYFMPLLLESSVLETTLIQHHVIIDNQLGAISHTTNWDHPKIAKPLKVHIKNKVELREFKRFLFRRLGMYRPFWMPTYERNLRLKSSGTISTTLDIELDQFIATNRRNIVIKVNGVWTAHSVTNAVLHNTSTARLTITPALNKPANQVQMISYLGLYRLNEDAVTIQYKGAGIASATVEIMEIEG